MNDYSKLEKTEEISKQLCINYLKQKFQTEMDLTVGNKGLSYEHFKNNIHDYVLKPYVSNMIVYYSEPQFDKLTEDQKYRRIFSLYFGSINIFKPSVAKFVCDKFQPFSVLDPFAGWGSRMLGCIASESVMKYTGIDINQNLRKGYYEIREELGIMNLTEIIFDDSLNIDYKHFTYDMVLTSPPYYNLELYRGTEKRSKEEWREFYKKIFTKIYENLQHGGWCCINVNKEIYDTVLFTLWGVAHEFIEYPKTSHRRKQLNNKEYIYCWKKINTQ